MKARLGILIGWFALSAASLAIAASPVTINNATNTYSLVINPDGSINVSGGVGGSPFAPTNIFNGGFGSGITGTSSNFALSGLAAGSTIIVNNTNSVDGIYVLLCLTSSCVATPSNGVYVGPGTTYSFNIGANTYIAGISSGTGPDVTFVAGGLGLWAGAGGGAGGGLSAVPTTACSTLPVPYVAGQLLVDPLGNLCVGGSFTVNTITGYATAANQTTEITALQTLAGTVGSTPVAFTAYTVVTGGTANNAFAASVARKGCYITNPSTATEPLYVNPVTTAVISETNANSRLAAGQTWVCPPGITTAVSVIATTTAHAFGGAVW